MRPFGSTWICPLISSSYAACARIATLHVRVKRRCRKLCKPSFSVTSAAVIACGRSSHWHSATDSNGFECSWMTLNDTWNTIRAVPACWQRPTAPHRASRLRSASWSAPLAHPQCLGTRLWHKVTSNLHLLCRQFFLHTDSYTPRSPR